jgi:hypothetical protein
MCRLCVWFAQRLALAETFCIPALAPKPPAFRQRDVSWDFSFCRLYDSI